MTWACVHAREHPESWWCFGTETVTDHFCSPPIAVLLLPFIFEIVISLHFSVLHSLSSLQTLLHSLPHSSSNSWPLFSLIVNACIYVFAYTYILKYNPSSPYNFICTYVFKAGLASQLASSLLGGITSSSSLTQLPVFLCVELRPCELSSVWQVHWCPQSSAHIWAAILMRPYGSFYFCKKCTIVCHYLQSTGKDTKGQWTKLSQFLTSVVLFNTLHFQFSFCVLLWP